MDAILDALFSSAFDPQIGEEISSLFAQVVRQRHPWLARSEARRDPETARLREGEIRAHSAWRLFTRRREVIVERAEAAERRLASILGDASTTACFAAVLLGEVEHLPAAAGGAHFAGGTREILRGTPQNDLVRGCARKNGGECDCEYRSHSASNTRSARNNPASCGDNLVE
ncbi:MAG TPA: hypothetical protein VM925_03440 [Labilithrix sp.]|nr:hypothetical protein [Labilithrix sp.]